MLIFTPFATMTLSTENWEKDHQKDIEPDFNVNADIWVQVGVGAEADDSIIFFAE